MKKENTFTNILAVILFFANIWINGYIFLLNFLNSNLLSKFKTSSDLLIDTHPEPFELPLYIFMAAIMLLVINISFKKLTLFFSKRSSLVKFFLFFLFLFLFAFRLGQYPMAEELTQSTLIKATLYVSIVLLIILASKLMLAKITKGKFIWIYYFFIFLIIAIFLFEPRFPIGPSDYAYFLGPIHEILSGKTIYTDVPSQYGFLSVLFFSFLGNWFSPLFFIPYLVYLLLILEYFLPFYIIYKISRSIALSLIALFSIITINYFSLIHLGAQNPQNPLRWSFLIIALFVFSLIKNIQSKILIFFVSLLSFWMLDAGIELIIAYAFTLLTLFLAGKIRFKQVSFALFYFFLNLFFIFFLINAAHIILGYKTVNLFLVFSKLQEISRNGIFMTAIAPNTFFWIITLFYIASIVFYLKHKDIKEGQLLVFSANLSLAAGMYFVGNSISHNLFHILMFAILNIFLLFSILYRRLKPLNAKVFLFFIFFLFVVIPAYSRQQAISVNIGRKLERLDKGDIFIPEINQKLNGLYRNELNLIKERFPQPQLLILSPDDTYLFYLSKKYNLISVNPQMMLYSINDINRVVNSIASCPEKILVSCSFFNKNCNENLSAPKWYPKTQEMLVRKIEEKCSISNVPSYCTSRLCMVGK